VNFTALLFESKQSIVNLGFPEVVASIFMQKFGKDAFTIATWFKEHISSSYPNAKDWFRLTRGGTLLAKPDAYVLTRMYETLKAGDIAAHNDTRDKADLPDLDPEKTDIQKELSLLKNSLEEALLGQSTFFSFNIMSAYLKGQLKTLQGYDHLSFREASDKFENKMMFQDATPIKVYPNGWKWINVGKKCSIIGREMKNCGSTGLMGTDPNIGLLTLFDQGNTPHVVATHLPGQNQITNPEGQGSTEVKDEYIPLVLDLARVLGAEIRDDTKSRHLNLQIKLGSKLKASKRLYTDTFTELFSVKMNNGKSYYTDSFYLLPKEDLVKITSLTPKPKNVVEKLKVLFNHYTREQVKRTHSDVRFIRMYDFASDQPAANNDLSLEEAVFGN
jgi:hypothetical protein